MREHVAKNLDWTPELIEVIRVMRRRGYAVFAGRDFDLNLVGIRASARVPERFDDLLYCFYRAGTQWCLNIFSVTTDPGVYWLKRPMVKLGTAVVKPGQYRGLWRIGLHRGLYSALVQVKPVTVFRDGNLDNVANVSGPGIVEETGLFGINLHRAASDGVSETVDRWSAGCQVVAGSNDFELLMTLCRAGARYHGNSFSYTLLEEEDFEQRRKE